MSTTLELEPDRLFIDATYTLGSGKSSGIERVVRSLLREFEAMGGQARCAVPQLVVSHGGEFYPVGPKDIQAFEDTAAMQANVLSAIPAWYEPFAQATCRIVRSQRCRKWLLPKPGHLGLFKLWHSQRELGTLRRIASSREPIRSRYGDLWLLPDAYWINRLRHSVWPAAAKARSAGAVVASVIYDLIPLTHPEFVGERRSTTFLEYLKQAALNSDALLAISQTVRDQVRTTLEANAKSSDDASDFCNEVHSFELGAELRTASGEARDELKQLFAKPGPTPYLMVSTFDPRKNHHYLLDAFDRLWQQGDSVKLCLVGRVGSRCDQLLDRLRQHPELGKRLHHFDDLSDAEVQFCYRQARGVVFPSIVEGFGLPIVESLWFGRKTFASDTPIHREVGQSDCCYFDLADCASLCRAIRDWEHQLADQPNIELPQRSLTTWSDSSQQVWQHCRRVYQSASQRVTNTERVRAA